MGRGEAESPNSCEADDGIFSKYAISLHRNAAANRAMDACIGHSIAAAAKGGYGEGHQL